jgi:hypothetical protein
MVSATFERPPVTCGALVGSVASLPSALSVWYWAQALLDSPLQVIELAQPARSGVRRSVGDMARRVTADRHSFPASRPGLILKGVVAGGAGALEHALTQRDRALGAPVKRRDALHAVLVWRSNTAFMLLPAASTGPRPSPIHNIAGFACRLFASLGGRAHVPKPERRGPLQS